MIELSSQIALNISGRLYEDGEVTAVVTITNVENNYSPKRKQGIKVHRNSIEYFPCRDESPFPQSAQDYRLSPSRRLLKMLSGASTDINECQA